MRYGLFQAIEIDEVGDGNPCWYVYDLYDTYELALEARERIMHPDHYLIMQVW